MAVDLEALNNPQAVDGLEVRVVADEEALRTWAHIFTLGYGLPAEWEPSIYDLQLRLGLGFPIRNYVGYLNDEPVATSTIFFGAGVAGIYSVSTLPEARGKGIGAAVTLRPLNNAREMGYRAGVLQSSDMGYNIYKKLSFRHLCQIEHFYLALR
jgi:GNAT superfamily N-acetyltransferase